MQVRINEMDLCRGVKLNFILGRISIMVALHVMFMSEGYFTTPALVYFCAYESRGPINDILQQKNIKFFDVFTILLLS